MCACLQTCMSHLSFQQSFSSILFIHLSICLFIYLYLNTLTPEFKGDQELIIYQQITKTYLFKYIEIFTTKN